MSFTSTLASRPGLAVNVKRDPNAPRHDYSAFLASLADSGDGDSAPAPAQMYPSPPASDTEGASRPAKCSAPAIETDTVPRPTKTLKRTASSAHIDTPTINALGQTELQAASAAKRGKKLLGQLTDQASATRAHTSAFTTPSSALKEAIGAHGVPLALRPELQGLYTPFEESCRQARYIQGVRGSCASGSSARPEKTSLGFRFPKVRPTRAEVEEAREREIDLTDHRLSRVEALNRDISREARRREEEDILSAAEAIMHKEGGSLSSAIAKVREERAARREHMPVPSRSKRVAAATTWPAVFETDEVTGRRELVKPKGIPATVKQWVAAQQQTRSLQEAKELCRKWYEESKTARRL